MAEFRLMETLQYKSENSEIEGEFLIGNETLWASRIIVAEILEQLDKIYHSIFKILYKKKN